MDSSGTPPQWLCSSTRSAGKEELAEEGFAAGRDLRATGLIKPVAILNQLHSWFALCRKSFPADKDLLYQSSATIPVLHTVVRSRP